MKAERVKSRGFLFTFEDPYKTTIYVINAPNHLYFCDTFLGPDPMKDVINFLEKEGISNKKIVVFNTHYDYDHFWGNQVFKNEMIIAHKLCKEKIEKSGEEDLRQFESHKRGEIHLTLPNTIFIENMEFSEDGISFFHSPGHTPDSSSCYDRIDKVLIVGDNIESPFPYLREPNFDDYISTLQHYLTIDAEIIISGHNDLMKDTIFLKENLSYLEAFRDRNVDIQKLDRKRKITHFVNLKTLGEFYHDKKILSSAEYYYNESLKILEIMVEDVQGRDQQIQFIKEKLKEIAS